MVFSFNSGYHQHRISILLQTDMGLSMSWVIRLIKDIERINDHILSRCMLLSDQMCSFNHMHSIRVATNVYGITINVQAQSFLILCSTRNHYASVCGLHWSTKRCLPSFSLVSLSLTPIVLVTFNSCLLII